ncbi:MAG: DUF2493 domain-containing protein [Desulfovibrionaceae bacterium]|nr:DUF2493 domain-containing protein [Desulfovibrionaceae bacterium]
MNKLNICIAGSHSFENYVILSNIVNEIASGLDKFALTFISGNARGADSLDERYAKEHGFDLEIYPANWKKYGKEAGFIRNNKMASISDVLIAFWDGKSHGTNDMIKKCLI